MNLYSSNKQKVDRKKSLDEGTDTIDNLPDVLLQHILSFLSTKDAIRASILSKRWKNLWKFVPNLDFHEGESDKRIHFLNFVDKVIGAHDSSSIQSFSLSCNVLSDASCISKWIANALSHKVENLYLRLRKVHDESFLLPPCLFTCNSLVSLRLHLSYVPKLPSQICFSSLRKLKLIDIVFPDDHSTQQLFSNCPVLEELEICNCRWMNVKAVCICAPMLRELKITDDIDEDDDSDSGSDSDDDENNVEDDQNDYHCCQFVIFGKNLESFSFCGQLRYEYCLLNSSRLVDATLDLRRTQREIIPFMSNDYAFHVYKLLRNLSDVESLSLSQDICEAVTHAEELFATLPVFPNLTYLEFIWWPMDISCAGLATMLRSFPYVETIEFTQGVEQQSCRNDESIFNPVPPCFLTHLKTITIGGFTGADHEIEAIEILLENATCLESMIIDFFCFDLVGDLNKLKEVQKQLLLLPKESACCELEFWNNPWEIFPKLDAGGRRKKFLLSRLENLGDSVDF